jgi:hypothetical protein
VTLEGPDGRRLEIQAADLKPAQMEQTVRMAREVLRQAPKDRHAAPAAQAPSAPPAPAEPAPPAPATPKLASASAPPAPAAPESAAPSRVRAEGGRRFAVIVANGTYRRDPRLEDLRCPPQDAEDLAAVLSTPSLGAFTQVEVLKDRDHHEVMPTVLRTLKGAGKDDLVLLYYSGHGKLNLANHLHLCTADTEVDALEATSISLQRLRDYVDVSPCGTVVLVLDCCFGGAAGDAFARGGVDDQLQALGRGRGMYIMTASTGVQVALERESDRNGVFTKHLVQGLRSGEADLDGDGLVHVDELYRYVHDRVRAENFQEPMKWSLGVRGEAVVARTAALNDRRRTRLREALLRHGNDLPEAVQDEAMKLLFQRGGLDTVQRERLALLDRLASGSLPLGRFLDGWERVAAQGDAAPSEDAAPDAQWIPVPESAAMEGPFPATAELSPAKARHGAARAKPSPAMTKPSPAPATEPIPAPVEPLPAPADSIPAAATPPRPRGSAGRLALPGRLSIHRLPGRWGVMAFLAVLGATFLLFPSLGPSADWRYHREFQGLAEWGCGIAFLFGCLSVARHAARHHEDPPAVTLPAALLMQLFGWGLFYVAPGSWRKWLYATGVTALAGAWLAYTLGAERIPYLGWSKVALPLVVVAGLVDAAVAHAATDAGARPVSKASSAGARR